MWLKCTKPLLAACGLVLLMGLPASAQGLGDMQLFAPADLGGFGGGPRAPEGLFFGFDWLYWSIGQPDASPIGTSTGEYAQYNVETNGFITSAFRSGERFELGTVHGHEGLLFSVYSMGRQSQHLGGEADPKGGSIFFGADFLPTNVVYPDDVNLLYAESLLVRNIVDTWGLELNYLLRSHPLHDGGIIEVFGGVRYIEFNEKYGVNADRTYSTIGSDDELEDRWLSRNWLTTVNNHIIGPQVGARWFKQWGRWQASAEGRYLAGFNIQSLHQIGEIAVLINQGQVLVPDEAVNSFNSAAYGNSFSSTAELRLELKYQFTRAISLKVGWTGLWIDRIVRASEAVSYDDPVNGVAIKANRHQEDVLLNGLNIGFTINR
jgi:hypothetical protein